MFLPEDLRTKSSYFLKIPDMTPNSVEDALRNVMRHVPSPVTVVTFIDNGVPRGVTIGSFASVSLDPPLISFNVIRESSSHDALLNADSFLIHILGEDQASLSEQFAVPELTGEAQFGPVSYRFDDHGLPLIEDVVSTVRCQHFDRVDAGDHSLLLGRVMASTLYRSGPPLIYYRSAYHALGKELLAPIR